MKDFKDLVKLLKKHLLKRQNLTIYMRTKIIIIFMDPKSFEQIEIAKDKIGDKGKLLTENLEVSVSFYNKCLFL